MRSYVCIPERERASILAPTLFEKVPTIAAYFISTFYCAGYSHISEAGGSNAPTRRFSNGT